jgi:anti-sigma B factor antagonist
MTSEWDAELVAPGSVAFRIMLVGEVDITRRDELRALAEEYEATTHPNVQVDLTAVTFIDSTGMGFLARLYRRATELGGEASVVGLSEMARRVLKITNLDHLLRVIEPGDTDQADRRDDAG